MKFSGRVQKHELSSPVRGEVEEEYLAPVRTEDRVNFQVRAYSETTDLSRLMVKT